MKKFNLSYEMFFVVMFDFYEDDNFRVLIFKYFFGVEVLKVFNSWGYFIFLLFYGLMVWDVVFDGIILKEKDGFSQLFFGKQIFDIYGVFEFIFGLLVNGNFSFEDNYV